MVKDRKGFTLIEVLVAMGILLIIATVAGAFLVTSTDRAIKAGILENCNNIMTAVNTSIASMQKHLEDSDGDGDYLDELIALNVLDRLPVKPSCAAWYLRRNDDGNGHYSYYVEIDLSSCNERVSHLLEEIDQDYDDGDGSSGNIRRES